MLRAYAGTLAVIVVPGVLVASILGLRLRELSTWAAVPALSLATTFVMGEAVMVLHASFGLEAFAVLLLLLVVLAGVVRVARSRGLVSDTSGPGPRVDPSESLEPRLRERVDRGLLVLGIALGGLIWHRGLLGVPLVPPGGDATRHGWMVERVISGHTIDPTKVVTSDVAGLHSAAEYYPLALHASAALSTRLVSADVARVLVAYIVVFSAIVLPVGMFVLARALAPERPLIAGFTALVVPLVMLFPYYPVWAGDIPQIIGMALAPIAVVLLVRTALSCKHTVWLSRALLVELAPAVFAVLCIVALHASELPIVLFLALLLVLERAWRKHDVGVLKFAPVRGIAVGLCAAVLFAPTLLSFARGVSERAPIGTFAAKGGATDWAHVRETILWLHPADGTVRQGFLAILALAGAGLWLVSRRFAWIVAWAGVAILVLLTSAPRTGLAYDLTFPWYHLESRVVPNLAFFVPVFAGVALGYGVSLITRVVKRSWAILPAALIMTAVLAVSVGIHGYRAETRYVRASFDPNTRLFFNQALIAESSLHAFRWLRVHAAPGDTVASEPQLDGSLWMYSEEHVSPLIGVVFREISAELDDRLYLIRNLHLLGRDARADGVARRYHTRWVLYDRVLPFLSRRFNLEALRANPALTAVFHEGGTWVFRINA